MLAPEHENPYDGLAPDLLPPTAGMELDYRTTDATDKEARHATLRFFLATGGVGALVAFAVRAVAESTATSLFLSVVALLMTLHVVSLYLNGVPRAALIGWSILGPALWLLSVVTTAGLHVVLWLIAGALAIQLAHSVVTHRAMWMHAHPQLDRPTRMRWRSVWKHATLRGTLRAFASPSASLRTAAGAPKREVAAAEAPAAPPVDDPSLALLAPERRELQHYYVALAFVLVALLAATLTAMLVPGPFFSGLAGLLVYITALLIYGAHQAHRLYPDATWIEVCRIVYDAWSSWFSYNYKQTVAPGVFQSPAGSMRRRFITTYYISLMLALALVPVCAYFPIPVLFYGNGPWIDAGARSWVMSEELDNPANRPSSQSNVRVPEQVLKHIPPSQREAYVKARLATEEWNARRRAAAVRLQSYEGYLLSTLQGMTRGETFFFFSMTASVFACYAAIGVFLLSTSFALGARRLLHHARTLEGNARAPGAYQRVPQLSRWEAYVDRLRQSRFRVMDSKGRPVRECDHLFFGCNPVVDYPILMDRRILHEHAHITGDTGSGKTALGIAPLAAQLIGLPHTSVVIIDLKGDAALFEAARIRVDDVNGAVKRKKQMLRFKWYTNHQGRHTFAFNPFLQGHFRELTIQQKASILLQSLGLDYGEGFGPSYFSAIHRDTLVKVLREDQRISSFRDLSRYFAVDLRPRRKELNIEKRQHEEGTHLYTVVDLLAANHALNITAESAPNPEVIRYQIDMSAVVRRPHVVYFYLSAPLEESSARETAKLALHSLLTAAVHRGKSNHQVYVFVDEFQQVVSTNIEIVLRQARSHGISVILANQTLSDLKKNENINLIPTVQANTRLRQVFSASDLAAQEMLSLGSGEQSRYSATYGWTTSRIGGESFSLSEQYGPRIRRDDVISFSDREQHSLVQITRGRGWTQFGGRLFPVFSDFHISQDEYERRSDASWPGRQPGTYVPPRESAPAAIPPPRASAASAGTAASAIPPAAPKPPAPPEQKDDLEERLDNLFASKEPPE